MEIGPKDVEKGTVAFARRDKPGKEGKSFVPADQLKGQVAEILQTIQASLYEKALAFRESNTYNPIDYAEFIETVKNGWAYSWWCGKQSCEAQIKEETKATTRCIPLNQNNETGKCIHCGSPASEKAIFARSY